MKKFRNFIIFLLLVFLFYINITFTFGEPFSSIFYLISFDISFSVFIIIEVFYSFQLLDNIRSLQIEVSKLNLSLGDYQLEGILLTTIMSLIETEELKVEEVIEKIA